jgi:hypothetical protein
MIQSANKRDDAFNSGATNIVVTRKIHALLTPFFQMNNNY